MVNQLAIATALGLSTATVSRALRGRGSHDPRTRALVLEEAGRQGYRLPQRDDQQDDTPARVPAIAVVLATAHPRHGDLPTVALRLLQGISARARVLGLMLHVEYLARDADGTVPDPADSPALRAGGGVDGAIVIGDVPAASLGALAKRFPLVRICVRDPGCQLDVIGQDDVAAIGELMAHLRSLGHRGIGFCGDGTSRSFINARAAAFQQAMLQQGDGPAPLVNVGRETLDAAACAARVAGFIAQGTTAWICIHDERAHALTRMLRERGLRVPEDVSICGFDALPTPHGLPAMTTIDWPFEDLGGEAVKRVRERLAAPDEPLRMVALPGRLVVRESTARAPSGRV
jgi:LacI family transcriptional regulator